MTSLNRDQTCAETRCHTMSIFEDRGGGCGLTEHFHTQARNDKLDKDIPTLGDRGCGFSFCEHRMSHTHKQTIVYLDIHKHDRVNWCVNAAVSALCLLLDRPQCTTSIIAHIKRFE